MAGCFGNHPVDRYLEDQLFRYLDESTTLYCEKCDYKADEERFIWDDEAEKAWCPECNNLVYED